MAEYPAPITEALLQEITQLQPLVEGLTEFAVIFRYPEEWNDEETAMQSLAKAEQVRVRRKLGLAEENG